MPLIKWGVHAFKTEPGLTFLAADCRQPAFGQLVRSYLDLVIQYHSHRYCIELIPPTGVRGYVGFAELDPYIRC